MPTQKLLSVWSRFAPQSGTINPGELVQLSKARRFDAFYGDAGNGAGSQLLHIFDEDGHLISPAKEAIIGQNTVLSSLTLLGVTSFRFYSGTSATDISNFAGQCLPQLPPAVSGYVGRLAFDWHRPEPTDPENHRYARLSEVAGAPMSMLRLTRYRGGGEDHFPQFLMFRFPFRAPVLADIRGHSTSEDFGGLDPGFLQEVSCSGNDADPNAAALKFLGRGGTAAEQREAGARRMPYFAGVITCNGPNQTPYLESFAGNAAVVGLAAAIDAAHDQTGAGSEKWVPRHPDRLKQNGNLADGYWWAWASADKKRLTLADHLKGVSNHPDNTNNATRKVLTALFGEDPNASKLTPITPDLAVLELVGLKASASAPPRRDAALTGKEVPLHYLHTRVTEDGLEWRRWLTLAPIGEDSRATPVLLRVRECPEGAEKGQGRYSVTLEGLTDAHVLALWSRRVAEPLRSLARDRGGRRALSLLPNIVGAVATDLEVAHGGRWVVQLTCHDEWAEPQRLVGSQSQPPCPADFVSQIEIFQAETHADGCKPNGNGIPDYFGTPVPVPPEPAVSVALIARELVLTEIGTHEGERLSLGGGTTQYNVKLDPALLRFGPGPLGWTLETPHTLDIQSTGESDNIQMIAVGGLDLQLKGAANDVPQGFKIKIEANDNALSYTVGVLGDQPMTLSVAKALVGGTDEVALAPASQPLLWANEALAEFAHLKCVDRVDPDTRRRLTAFSLHARANPPAIPNNRIAVTVLDATPMVVAEVETEKLGIATDTKDTIATWDSEEAVWRLTWSKQERPTNTLTLPPQGVAEAWERHGSGITNGFPDDQVAPGERVPARLTPASRFVIESEERERNPVAPWNLRRLMTDLEVDLPGARLARIDQMEALYGLEAKTGDLKGMRLAEIAAWRGSPRVAPDRDESRFREWKVAREAWQSRLGVYELRPEDDPLARPKVEDVDFRLRLREQGGKHAKSIVANDGEVDKIWSTEADGGILGGAMAGFEQVVLIKALLRDAANGRGEIDGLQLSALGAWTRPNATFNNGLTLISADLEMGRVHEARFERIGRIGNIHHIAKHVIVYRRSFQPSAQFAGEQDPHLGRPIIRKAEEYIEIIQKVRTYPDRTGATERNTGWLLGKRFRTVRIPVHGSWAEGISDPRFEGYSIPLWREPKDLCQSGQDPRLYPRPVIEGLIATDPALTDPEPPARTQTNPQRLRFYTIASVRTDAGLVDPARDPDDWPYVYGLDTLSRPLLTPISGKLSKDDFRSSSGASVTLPPADEIPPGLEAFTYTYEAGPLVNISQARNGKPTLVDVRTATMLRGTPLPIDDSLATDAGKVFQGLADASGPIAELADIARRLRSGSLQAADGLKEAKDKIDKLKTLLPPASTFKPRDLCLWVHEPEERLMSLASWLLDAKSLLPTQQAWANGRRDLLVVPLNQISDRLRSWSPVMGAINAQIDPGVAAARTVLNDLSASAIRELDALNLSAASGIKALDRLTKVWAARVKNLRDAADSSQDLTELLDDLQREVSAESERLRRSISDALQSAESAVNVVLKAAANARGPLAKLIPGEISKFDSLLSNLQGALSETLVRGRKLDAGLGKFSFDLDLLIASARRAATSEIAAIRGKIVALLCAGKTAVADGGAWSTDKARQFLNDLGVAATSVTDAVASRLQDPFDERVAMLRSIVPTAAPAADDLITSLLKGIADLRQRALSGVQDYPTEDIATLKNAFVSLCNAVKSAAGELKTATDPICNDINTADTYLNKILTEGESAYHFISSELDAVASDLGNLANRIDKAATAFDMSLGQLRHGVEDVLDGQALEILKGSAVNPKDIGQAVALNVLRAAGAPPVVEQLVFNRDRLAYYFEQETNRILVTPVTALMDQADQALKGIGITLPTLAIDEELISYADNAFDAVRAKAQGALATKAKEVLRDFASLKDMFPRLEFDGRLAAGVRISQDYDAKRNLAWLQADVAYGPDTQDLFRMDAFAVTAEKMQLQGRSRYERSLSGGETRSVTASVTSDWVLEVGGTRIVRIRNAVISYDQASGLSFDIKPENIEFNELLKLISDAVAAFTGEDSPIKLELLMDEAIGRPIGLRSRYDMPPTTFGVPGVTIMNASLGVHLDLAQRAEFEVRAFAYLGRQDTPFAFIVGWLGGGGYLEAEARHRPASGQTDLALRISIGAAAGIGFNFGPLAGRVQVYLGFEATYFSSSTGSQLTIAGIIVINGAVRAWGFVTIGLGMRLAVTYEGSTAVGRGHVDVSVKVSRFYTQRFSSPINYRL